MSDYLNLGPADFDSSEIFGLELPFHALAYRHVFAGQNILRATVDDYAKRGDLLSDYAAKVYALKLAMSELADAQDRVAEERAVFELLNGSSQNPCTGETE
jgi:hypothetical protein